MFARLAVSREGDQTSSLDAFSEVWRAALPDAAGSWWSDAELGAGVRGHLEAVYRKCSDIEVAAQLRKLCPLAGCEEQDYLARLFENPEDGRQVLASIRFKGLQVERPFVEIEATSFGLSWRALNELLAMVRVQFRRTRPRWMRVFVGADQGDVLDGDAPWDLDLVVMAGKVGELQARPRPPRSSDLRLVPWSGDYRRYRSALGEVIEERPELGDQVEALTEEDASRLAGDGWLFDAFAGDSWVGAVGAFREPFHGAPGIAIHEQLIATEHQGRGLGVALQRALIDELPTDAVLWGTIDGRNRASLRTARRCGRIELGHYRLYSL